jgi:hypothetical protein
LVSQDIALPGYETPKIPFTVANAGNYQIQTSYYLTDCDTVLYLYDSSDTLITTNDDYNDFYSCIIMWLELGTYFVEVEEITSNPVYCHLEVARI